MSVPKDRDPDPHADPLVAAVLRASLDDTSTACPSPELLALFAERGLRDEELPHVERHVVGCARCQATVAAFVRGAAAAEPAAAGGGTAVAWWAGWRWLVPLASAAALLTVAVWVGRDPADPLNETPQLATVSPTAKARAGRGEPSPELSAQAATEILSARKQDGTPLSRRAVPPSAPATAGAAGPAQATTTAAPAAAARAHDAASAAAPAESVADAAAIAALIPLTGTVAARTHVALPAGAVIEVRLLDLSRPDAPAHPLGRVEIVTRGEPLPVPFTLRYDAGAIQPGRRYVVQATIAIDGRVTWRTATPPPVLTAGAAATPVTVTVEEVR